MALTTPAAPSRLSPSGRVDVEFVLGKARLVINKGFGYQLDRGFVRGDANADGFVDISDALAIIFYLFRDEPAVPCDSSVDLDDSGDVNSTDALSLLNFLCLGAPPPRAPFPACGSDPSADSLSCEVFSVCES